MTTKTISGTFSSGYALSSGFSEVEITASGRIGGFGLLSNNGAFVLNYGRLQATFAGNNGLSMAAGGQLFNGGGAVIGGGPGQASSVSSQAGGTGGSGAVLYAIGGVSNYGVLEGGQGGYGDITATGRYGGVGGTGGAGIAFRTSATLVNIGAVQGGQGGHGGYGYVSSNSGGGGGVGVLLQAGDGITNLGGQIYGGAGGTVGKYIYGGYNVAGRSGTGGAAVDVVAGGLVRNTGGLIQGGIGGACSPGFFDVGGNGGDGGSGVYLSRRGTVINGGTITGGAGRNGEYGFDAGGNGGAGGDGVVLNGGGKITNIGVIEGGAGGTPGGALFSGHYGAYGFQGIGLNMIGGAVTNGSRTHTTAVIDGHFGVQTGAGDTATVTNFGTISGESDGWAVLFASHNDTLVVEAGCVFKGGINGGLGTLDLASGKGLLTGFAAGGNITVSGSMATTTFQNFGTVEIGAKAQFTLSGNGVVAVGQSLVDAGVLHVSKLNVNGSLTLSGELLGVGRRGVGTVQLAGGTINLDAGALLLLPHVEIETTAADVEVNTSLGYAGQWIQQSGSIDVAAGDTLTFTGGANVFTGYFKGAGQVRFQGGSDYLQDLTQAGAGSIAIGGAGVTLAGSIEHDGMLSISAATVTIAGSGVTLYGGETVLSDSAANRIVGSSASATFDVGDNLHGAGALGGGFMSLVNYGVITGDGTNTLIIDTGTNTVANFSMIVATGAGGVSIAGAVNNTGELIADGGNLTVAGAVTGFGTGAISGGVLTFESAFSENVSFNGPTGELALAQSRSYGGTISGFSKTGGTSLDLADIGFVSVGEATYKGTKTGGTLTVTDGAHTVKIALSGDYRTSTFVASDDGLGGVIVRTSAAPANQPPAHALIAAMAGLGPSAAASLTGSGGYREEVVALVGPRPAAA